MGTKPWGRWLKGTQAQMECKPKPATLLLPDHSFNESSCTFSSIIRDEYSGWTTCHNIMQGEVYGALRCLLFNWSPQSLMDPQLSDARLGEMHAGWEQLMGKFVSCSVQDTSARRKVFTALISILNALLGTQLDSQQSLTITTDPGYRKHLWSSLFVI